MPSNNCTGPLVGGIIFHQWRQRDTDNVGEKQTDDDAEVDT